MNINDRLPVFRNLPGVDGKEYSADDFAEAKVLVVVFSCNHCPYVKAYEDRMISFQREYGPKEVQLVAVNSNETENYPEDNFDEMVKRTKAKGFNFPYLRDDDQKIAEVFGATHTPEFFVFDAERTLRYHGKMDDNYQNPAAVKERYLQDVVDALLAGKPVGRPETHSIGCTIKWRVWVATYHLRQSERSRSPFRHAAGVTDETSSEGRGCPEKQRFRGTID